MSLQTWQLKKSIDAIVFDCDGTLSRIEGIDELAKTSGFYHEVQQLTAQAMGISGMSPMLYQKRMELVCPNQEQVLALGQKYFSYRVPDIQLVLKALTFLNKQIYIISAGLFPAVAIFGELLKIPRTNIFAVNINFDEQGNFLNYDKNSPLIQKNGKRTIISNLKNLHPQIVYIGDGLSDLAAYDLVTRFIGYGGTSFRKNIAERCEYYINDLILAPVLPLSLTIEEYKKLKTEDSMIYNKGLEALINGKVKY